ncbi:RidA family protein [Salinarimonas soli]|nr:RidA family protein [Salinarimonas soli]
MPRFFNPPDVAAPASRYSHGAEHAASARRLVISGQVAVRADGSVPETLEDQVELCLDNLERVLAGASMGVGDILKINVFCTRPGSVRAVRAARERRLGTHAPASTYLEVAGLADPRFLVEIEAEAVRD